MTLWIVEIFSETTVPEIKRYEAVDVRDTGCKVRHMGGVKFIPKAGHRAFFTDENKLRTYCRAWLLRKLDLLQSQVALVVSAAASGELYVQVEPADRPGAAKPPKPVARPDRLTLAGENTGDV